MKILIFGNIIFTKEIIKTILKDKKNKVCLVTRKKSFNSDHANFSDLSNRIILYYSSYNIQKSLFQKISNFNPDIVLALGWSHLIPEKVLNLTKINIGYHPSNLRHFRGKHPLIWPIILNHDCIHSTFFQLDKEIDNGKILDEKKIFFKKNEYMKTIYNRVLSASKKQVIKLIKKIKNNKKLKQKKYKHGAYFRKRQKIDGELNFFSTCEYNYNLIRALSKPYPGAHVKYKKQIFKIWKSTYKKEKIINFYPGKIINIYKKKITIQCIDGKITLFKHEIDLSILKKIKHL